MHDSDAEEYLVWEGHSSHRKDFWFHVLCVVTCVLIVPAVMIVWRYLETRTRRYEVTSERIRITQGIFSKRMDELELYRVKDTSLEQPFWLRVWGLGNVVVKTSDRSTGDVVIEAIPDALALRENLRGCIEKRRDEKGVREVDYR